MEAAGSSSSSSRSSSSSSTTSRTTGCGTAHCEEVLQTAHTSSAPLPAAVTSYNLTTQLENWTMTADFNLEIDAMQATLDHPQLGQSVGDAAGVNSTLLTSHLPPTTLQPAKEILTTIPFDQIIFVVCASSIIAATIFGNVLVIIAVFAESKLRKVGNFFIVSLAVSDLLVGLFVTPVALVYNLLGSWTFGAVFCDIWIAMDVVCCTASIVNLCVISFDRYNAITQPLRYALRRTASRAFVIIALIWAYSVFIAIPPFLGWSDGREHAASQCMISQNVGYTIFSTVGAYYLPLVVMIVMYLKVFRATQQRKRNWIPLVRRESYDPSGTVSGVKRSSVRKARVLINVADSTDRDDYHDELMERMERSHHHHHHRPRRAPKMSVLMTSLSLQSSGPKLGVTITVPSSQESLTTPSPECRDLQRGYLGSSIDEPSEKDVTTVSSHASRDFASSRKMLSICSSTESAGDISDESGYEMSPVVSPANSIFSRRMSPSRNYYKTVARTSSEKRMLFQKRLNPSFTTSTETTTTPTSGSAETLVGDCASTTSEGRVRFSFSRRSCKFHFRVESEIQEEELSRGEEKNGKLHVGNSPSYEEKRACVGTQTAQAQKDSVALPVCVDDNHLAQSRREKALTIERGRRRQRYLRRRRKNRISLNQERRAAKTLGIIMGCFVMCWMPFFILEVVKPFCVNCHFSPTMMKVFTWLGYLNSALNPIIYTFFNQDFRKGFQRIICCATKR